MKKLIKNIYYIGSFYKRMGIDLIYKIAQKMKDKNFYLYGERKLDKIPTNIKSADLKIFNFIKYREVPGKLKKADVLIMPHALDFVGYNSNVKDDISKFTIPIKMFEYLASGVPVFSSNLNALKEILIHKKNSIIVKNNKVEDWVNSIRDLDNNYRLKKRYLLMLI